MLRKPGIIFKDSFVFHPQLSDAQIAYIRQMKEVLDEVRDKHAVYDPKDPAETLQNVSGFSLYFREKMGHWTRNGVEVPPSKGACNFAEIWFYGISWHITYADGRRTLRGVTYTLRWEDLEKQNALPTTKTGKGTSRLKECKKKQKEIKRDATRRNNAKRLVEDRRKDREAAKRAAGKLRKRDKTVRRKGGKVGSGSRVRRKRTISISDL
jgi:hypothetical protein